MKKKDKNLVEAILFAASEPLDVSTIKSKLKTGTDVLKILYELQKDYSDRGVNLVRLADKWSFRTADDLSTKLKKDKFLNHFNINSLNDLPNADELLAAGLIDSRVDSSIFGTSKFIETEKNDKKENIYSNIDDMISDTLNEDK